MIVEKLLKEMFAFNHGDPAKIQHLTKVYAYAQLIGSEEGLSEDALRVLCMAAILHDIGIRPCEERFGHCTGKMQEEYGPAYAAEILGKFPEVTKEETERVLFLIARHHTYEPVEGMDHRILLEADFLVNAFEGALGKDVVLNARKSFFRTEAGTALLNKMFDL